MRKITLGGREITIVGSPMTPFFYKKEFRQSLSGDVMAMAGVDNDYSLIDDVNLLQMIWAMEKTAKMGQLITFEQWLSEFESLDLFEVMADVINEAMESTFRTA